MALKMEKHQWLLALDGSDDAFETVRYVSRLHSPDKRQLVLFTVYSKIPDVYWDLQKEPLLRGRLGEMRAWETHHNQQLGDYMARSKEILLDAGFAPEAIEIKLQERQKGIARDIIQEAGQGYTVVVVGRKDVSKIRGVLLGGVATKLLERITMIPMVIVGRGAHLRKILIAFDGSNGSFRAVDRVGALLGGSKCVFNITHVVRLEESARIAEAERFIAGAFDEAIERLVSQGIARKDIVTQVITGAPSRAETLVREAEQGGYGSIVVGRRGLSEVSDFSLGTVSNKVVQLAMHRAVWVVS